MWISLEIRGESLLSRLRQIFLDLIRITRDPDLGSIAASAALFRDSILRPLIDSWTAGTLACDSQHNSSARHSHLLLFLAKQLPRAKSVLSTHTQARAIIQLVKRTF
jgi:hypothetical protein